MSSMTQIKASAGSGKTWTLTQQFLAHLAACSPQGHRERACTLSGPEEDWRSILAITFTNAAASEMQERVLKVLKERALGLETSRDMSAREARIWLERIMHERSSLNISTIDSLLNLIVRMSALAEKLPPDFTPVFTTREILDPYWQNVSNEAWQGNEPLRALIARICEMSVAWSDRDDFKAGELIIERLTRIFDLIFRDKLGNLTPAHVFQQSDGSGILPALKQRLFTSLESIVRADGVNGLVMDKTFKKGLQKTLDLAVRALGKPLQDADVRDYARMRLDDAMMSSFGSASYAKETPKTTKASAPVSDSVQDLWQNMRTCLQELVPISHLYTQCRIHEPLLEMADIVYKRYTDSLQHEGMVHNDRIPVMVHRILSSDFGVADALCRMGTRISHFLVDEFQDTSREHWQALKPLVEEALASGGSFSWVGDVKQAIYGFRGGDSELFDDIAADQDLVRMLESDVCLKTLGFNWRSRAEIITFNNALFAPLDGNPELCARVLVPDQDKLDSYVGCVADVPALCPDAEDPAQSIVDYVAQKMARAYRDGRQEFSPKTKDGGSVTLLRFGTAPDAGQTETAEADAVAARVADEQLEAVERIAWQEHASGTPWADLLVLVRTNKKAMELARHLSSCGIPVITENSLLVNEHPLIVQTVALLSFLRAPEDDIAFWTLVSGSILARDIERHLERDGARNARDARLALLSFLRKSRSVPGRTEEDASAGSSEHDLWSEEDEAERWFVDEAREKAGTEAGEHTCAARLQEAAQHLLDSLHLPASAKLHGTNADRLPLAELWQRLCPAAWKTIFVPLRDACGSITPYDLVSEWYAREDVFARFPEARPFLQRFLEILHTSQARNIRSLGDFLDYWEQHGHEEKVPMPEGMDAVRIMTTHKAKGLQAPVVITPWTSLRSSSTPPTKVVEYHSSLSDTPLRALASCTNIFPMRTVDRLKEAFEAVNRFYVACTRAETRLYIFLSAKAQGDGKHLEKLLELAGDSIPEPVAWEAYRDSLAVPALLQETAGLTAAGAEAAETETGESAVVCAAAEAALQSAELTPGAAQDAQSAADGQEGNEGHEGHSENDVLWDMSARTGDAADPSWAPMAWMPKLRLHFDYLDESHPRDRAREEGILVHACLEELAKLPRSVRADEDAYALARERILSDRLARQPWLDAGDFAHRAQRELAWYAALDRRCRWMEFGMPEQSILTKSGKVLRTDLMVLHPEGPMVIEYKHGQTEEGFLRDYHGQVRAYLNTLRNASPASKPLGVIIYLKAGLLHIVHADGSSPAQGGLVSGQDAALTLLDETSFLKVYTGLGRSVLDA